MKKFILYLALSAIVALPLFVTPVSAGEEIYLKPGDKFISDEGLLTEFIERTPDGRYHYRVVIEAPQYTDDLSPIVCQWLYDSDKGEFYADANLFTAIVKKDKVTVEREKVKGQKHQMNWKPTIEIGTLRFKADEDAILLPVDPINGNYVNNTLEWDYDICKRYLRIIEGMLVEYYILTFDPGIDFGIKSNLYKDENFVWDRLPYAHDAEGKPIAISADKVILAGELARDDITYPITIDPSATFTASSSDGYIYKGDVVYATSHDAEEGDVVYDGLIKLLVGQDYDSDFDEDKSIRRVGVFLDTSGLPDSCNITSANLTLHGTIWDYSDVDFDVVVQSGMPTYPHDPIAVGDYLYTHYEGDGGSFNTSSFNSTGYNVIALNATGLGWINTAGVTKFCIRSSRDISSTAPTDGVEETVDFYSYEKGVGYRPQLVVVYSAPALPTITADAATYVQMTTARLNSTLTEDGGDVCEVRLQYNTTDNWSAYCDNTTWVDGYYTGDHPYADITGLPPDTLHYFRAQARNTLGTANSTSLSFTTEAAVSAPTDFKASPEATRIALSWTEGIGATNTLIRYKEGAYPTGTSDGSLVYDGVLGNYAHTGLSLGHSYYYSAWGYSGDNYSASYAMVMATTYAAVAEGDAPDAPDMPSTWFQTPDYTKFVNMPMYAQINTFVAALGMPLATGWLLLALAGCVFGALVVLKASRKATPTLITLAVLVAGVSLVELAPMWFLAFSVIFGLGAFQLGRSE